MELKLWPLLYLDLRWWRRPGKTSHHEPQKWKALPDFKRFDWHVCRTEALVGQGEPRPRMPWRLWVYWKDADGVIWGRHFDWLWFPPKRWCKADK